MSLGSYNTVSIGTSAALIMASNPERKGFIITNTDATATLYIGPDASVTTANGTPVYSKEHLSNSNYAAVYKSAVYGVSSSGTIDIRFWDQL